jgi:hypothetical protein
MALFARADQLTLGASVEKVGDEVSGSARSDRTR